MRAAFALLLLITACESRPPLTYAKLTATMRAAATAAIPQPPAFDDLLARVPSDAYAVLGIDLARAHSSRSVMEGLANLLRRIGVEVDVRAGRVVLAGTPAGFVVVTPSSPTDTGGGMADALAGVSRGRTGFGAIKLNGELKRELVQLIPDLEKLRWIAGTFDSTNGISITVDAVFPDAMTAAKLPVTISIGRKVAATQLPAAVATAFDKVAFTAMGNAIRISAVWTEADVQALSSIAR
ncbi:MAG: hypothetical protein H0T46_00105 [Deltaproteobacteria bacterium]|nr:hypothetical protein [Deltaproteobacteria bacterium]